MPERRRFPPPWSVEETRRSPYALRQPAGSARQRASVGAWHNDVASRRNKCANRLFRDMGCRLSDGCSYLHDRSGHMAVAKDLKHNNGPEKAGNRRAEIKPSNFGTCAVCGATIDLRDPNQVLLYAGRYRIRPSALFQLLQRPASARPAPALITSRWWAS
jgi:RNA polymerase-binding transcription factor DksA